MKQVAHDHHSLLRAEKETGVSVKEEGGSCPGTPVGVQGGRGGGDGTASELPARGGGAGGDRVTGVTVSDGDAVNPAP